MGTLKILVPTDFSDLSSQAFESAEFLRKEYGGEITPLYIFPQVRGLDGISISSGVSAFNDEVRAKIKKQLVELASRYTLEAHIKEPVVLVGEPSVLIADEAKNFDMVVMATHGRTGFNKAILGSVANKVLRTSPVPVLAVRKDKPLKKVKKVLIPVDLSAHSEKVFEFADHLLKQTGASAHLVNVISLDEGFSMSEARDLAKRRENEIAGLRSKFLPNHLENTKIETLISNHSVPEALVRIVDSRSYDLIVMPTLGHTGLKYLLMGSTAARVVEMAPLSVLIIPPEKS